MITRLHESEGLRRRRGEREGNRKEENNRSEQGRTDREKGSAGEKSRMKIRDKTADSTGRYVVADTERHIVCVCVENSQIERYKSGQVMRVVQRFTAKHTGNRDVIIK